MVKVIFGLVRRNDLTHDEFAAYWYERHAPLVREVADLLHIRRYVQSHIVGDRISATLASSRGAVRPFDGVAELWWDSLADMLVSTPESQEASARLIRDEKVFLDLASCALVLAEEKMIIGG
ncbi:EthD domain-containing protein [Frankia sp. Cr2]|uniref:EthD domain-containing protein n=1 Tax=Frankia sp. Cr2 TaxID=3073932 RepID=UPI002AD2FF2D|nr:EthD domain-containing protein [Frankia sp. Cr2]